MPSLRHKSVHVPWFSLRTGLAVALCLYLGAFLWLHRLHVRTPAAPSLGSDARRLSKTTATPSPTPAAHTDELSEVVLNSDVPKPQHPKVLTGSDFRQSQSGATQNSLALDAQPRQQQQQQPSSLTCQSVLVTHEYVPYAEHHGADTRLLDVLAALVALGCAQVSFLPYTALLEPSEMQKWEQAKPNHVRALEALGVHVVTKAQVLRAAGNQQQAQARGEGGGIGSGIGGSSLVQALGHYLLDSKPQFVVSTLWFWTWPVRPLWAGIVAEAHRQVVLAQPQQPSPLLLVLSDDVHGDREAKRNSDSNNAAVNAQATLRWEEKAGQSSSNMASGGGLDNGGTDTGSGGIGSGGGGRWTLVLSDPKDKASLLSASPFRTQAIRKLELGVYRRASAVVAITSDDQRRMKALLQLQSKTLQPPSPLQTSPPPPLSQPPPLPSPLSPPPVFTLRPTAAISPLEGSNSFRERSGFIFVGTGQNPTNVAAAQWLLRNVWPVLRRKVPGASLVIAGAPPPPPRGAPNRGGGSGGGSCWDESVATAEQQRRLGVRVVGFQKDLTPLLDRARVFLSPVRVSSGFNTKNLLALTHGVPLVTTSFGNTGLPPGAAAVVASGGGGSDRRRRNSNGDSLEEEEAGTAAPAAAIITEAEEEKEGEAEAFAAEASRLHRDVEAWGAQRRTAAEAARSAFSPSAVQQELWEALKGASLFANPSPSSLSTSLERAFDLSTQLDAQPVLFVISGEKPGHIT